MTTKDVRDKLDMMQLGDVRIFPLTSALRDTMSMS